MKHILFMVDMYYPKPRAVGICVHRIAVKLAKRGYIIHVIAYKQNDEASFEEFEGIIIHRIGMPLIEKLREYGNGNIDRTLGKLSYKAAGVLRKIQKLVLLPWFPLASPLAVYRFNNKVAGLHKMHNLDCVIAAFNPVETLYAGALIKKKNKNIKYGVFVLDSLINLSGENYLPPGLRKKLKWKFEKMVYETADVVVNPESLQKNHQSLKYEPYRNKIVFSGTPEFAPKQPVFTKRLYDTNKKHLVYMGTLLKSFRNPDYLYSLFQKINRFSEFQLHFYTRGECEDDLLRYQTESGGAVVRHGFVEHKKVDNILANADFLINLGVPDPTLDSSKILEYISTGKPIIHFYYIDDDYCLRYFEKYELSIAIKINESLFEENTKSLKDFLTKAYGKTVNPNKIAENFILNTSIPLVKHFENLACGNFVEN